MNLPNGWAEMTNTLEQIWVVPYNHNKWHQIALYERKADAIALRDILREQNSMEWSFQVNMHVPTPPVVEGWKVIAMFESVRRTITPEALDALDKILEAHG